ncbi:hypothetical protein LTR85_010385 [Meristemomyces frigidus]|nr:hypothetical protein LTR85_010385 [Meristemomyces frigidus]
MALVILSARRALLNRMNEGRKPKIATALHQYRETVAQHNILRLRILADGMEAQSGPPHWSPGLAEKCRIEAFDRFYLMLPLPESVIAVRDLFNDDVRAELTRSRELDGVCHKPVDAEARAGCFAALRTRIVEMNVDAAALAEFPPADLECLFTLVDSISGSGLPYYRQRQQLECEVPLRLDMSSDVALDARESNELSWVWDEWEIAVAVQIGAQSDDGFNGGGLALFCGNEDDPYHGQWKWRYGIRDCEESVSDVYDSVEDFLAFYAHFREQTEEQITKDIRYLNGMYPTAYSPLESFLSRRYRE